MTVVQAASLVAVAFIGGYAIFTMRRRAGDSSKDGETGGFEPRIGFSRLDGMASLALLLVNRSDDNVWVEEIEVFLTDLTATDQTAEPTCREVQKIRQMVVARDTLPISLARVIYKAAGEPQRRYTCVLSSVLRCRIGEKWIDRPLDTYRIRMAGLTASSAKRERKPAPPLEFKPAGKSADLPVVAARSK